MSSWWRRPRLPDIPGLDATPAEVEQFHADLYLFSKRTARGWRRSILLGFVLVAAELSLLAASGGWWVGKLLLLVALCLQAFAHARTLPAFIAARDRPERETRWVGPAPWPLVPGGLGSLRVRIGSDDEGRLVVEVDDEDGQLRRDDEG